MNIYLQIGIGLIPASIVMLVLIFKRKAFSFSNALLSLAVVTATIAAASFGIFSSIQDYQSEAALSKNEMLEFTYTLFEEGAYDEAWDMLDTYIQTHSFDDNTRLLSARLYVVEEDYEKADGLYSYLVETTDLISADDDEVKLTALKNRYSGSDVEYIDYLIENDYDITDYGYEDSYEDIIEAVEITKEDILDEISDNVQDSYDVQNSDYEDAAESIVVLDEIYEQYDSTGYIDEEALDDVIDDFYDLLEKLPSMSYITCFVKNILQAQVLTGDFEELVENLSENSSYHELMIAAELYMGNFVSEKDFSDAYLSISNSVSKNIEKTLENLYDKYEDSWTVQEAKNMLSRIEAIINELDDPVLSTLKSQLTDQLETCDGNDQTKVYLELAKIDNYFNNETSLDSNLNAALSSSQLSDDDTYARAMKEIISVINNDDINESENIKNVSDYVEVVMDNSLTIDVESIISSGYTESSTSSSDDTTIESKDFSESMVDYVSRIKSAINIGNIDTDEFEQITAKVQISSDNITDIDELKQALSVYDCGVEIEDFELTKIEYTQSNFLLCCDVSGSMSGSISDLQDAVTTFIADKNADEYISIVTFDSSIVDQAGFYSSDSELLALTESMKASGGTDMYSALLNCLTNFSVSDTQNSVVILMTDGQDGTERSTELIYSELGALAEEKGITVYTVGLTNSVNTSYLTSIADSCNGDFIYVNDSNSLQDFYDLLHEQIVNQYELTYTAVDTLTQTDRTLEIYIEEENAKDTKTYSIGEAVDYGDVEQVNATQNITINGLSVRYMYESTASITTKLIGTNFNKDDTISITFSGDTDYKISSENITFVSENYYTIKLPSSMNIGTYNVEISINGQKAYLINGFSVILEGVSESLEFGAYKFTATSKIENSDGSITMSGNVVMNNWLYFKGDLTFSGNFDSSYITVADLSGSYVNYDEDTVTGFAKYLYDLGVSFDIPSLGYFKIYNDVLSSSDYSDYAVESIDLIYLKIYNLLTFQDLDIYLYPYNINLTAEGGTTCLPMQDTILKIMDSSLPFEIDGEFTTSITNKNLGIKLDVDFSMDTTSSSFTSQISFLNNAIAFNGGVAVSIDTLENDYSLKLNVKPEFLGKGSGISLSLAWDDAKFDSAIFGMSFSNDIAAKLTFYIGAVPISFTEFSVGASDISDVIKSGDFKDITLEGTFSLEAYKLSVFRPGLEEIFGNLSLFSLPDTKLTLTINDFLFTADANLTFLTEITLRNLSIKLGTFTFANSLLPINGTEVVGLEASTTESFIWEPDNVCFSFNISGTQVLDITNKFVGNSSSGQIEFTLDLWNIDFTTIAQTSSLLGFYVNSDSTICFVFSYYDSNNNKICYYIDSNGNIVGNKEGILY